MLFKFIIYNLKFIISILFVFVLSLFILHYSLFTTSGAPDCLNPASITSNDDRDYCINEIDRLKNQYLPAQETNKKNLAELQSQLADLNKRINAMLAQLNIFAQDITKREEDMAYTQKIFEQKTVDNYMFLRTYDPISPFLFSDNASSAFTQIILRQKVAEEDRKTIEQYAEDINQLKKDKDSLEKDKAALDAVQKQVADKESFLAGEVAKVETYLATLSAKQQAFLAAKLESLGLSRSAYNMKGGCSSDISPFKDPGFSPAFGFFTFGVPNRVGLNQFGAKGRAEQGQDYESILRAYYNFDQIGSVDPNMTIVVNGTNEFGQTFNNVSMPLDEYLKHLYEMPTDWDLKALRAQAIAARSYAARVYNDRLADSDPNNNFLYPSQADQVVKLEINDGNWQAAVTDTSGKVMLQGGQPIEAWFSSTHGGYAFNSGDIWNRNTAWTKRMVDTPSGNAGSFDDLHNNAYDKGSPVFYCDWGSRATYNKTAWLTPTDLADIVNAILLVEKDGSTKSHLYQTDKPNPEGTDTWSSDQVKSNLMSRGGTPFDSVSDVSVNADFSTGRTISVTVSGNSGSQTINGDDFKNYFNLRAPSTIQIVGPLYNVEKR